MSAIMYKGVKYGGGGGGGANALSDLSDVDLSNPSDGQIIKYDAANQKWVNANESGGGGSAKRDVLYTANAQADTYSLAHPLTDYDEIWCFVVGGTGNRYSTSRVFDCNTLMDYAGVDMRFGITTDGWYSYFTVSNANTLTRADTGSFWMKTIIGIKYT